MNKRFILTSVFVFALVVTSNSIFGQNDPLPTLVQFVAEGSADDINDILSNNNDINAKINELGWTYLHAAVSFRRDNVVKKLVEMKADLDIQDNSGKTPLFVAVETGQYSIVDLLITNGAKVNISSNDGDNPLSMSQKIGLSKISDILLLNNAQPPVQTAPDQGQRSNRRGMMQITGNLNNMLNRRGPGESEVNQEPTETELPVNNDNVIMQNPNEAASVNLDPNEVQARIEKYPGLKEAIVEVADGSRSALRLWRITDKDNRTSLISAIRKQYQNEVQFIQKIATEEQAQKTMDLAKKFDDSRKSTFIAINREVRDNETTTTRTSTSSRRSGRTNTTTTTRNTRRGSSTTTQSTATTEKNEKKYSPEVQSEIDEWLNADITSVNGRMSLLDSVNSKIVSEINSIKQTANGEKAEKTVAAIDGLLVARQLSYNELTKELQGSQEEQVIPETPETTDMQNLPEYDSQDPMNQRGMNNGQPMTTGRGSRGR